MRISSSENALGIRPSATYLQISVRRGRVKPAYLILLAVGTVVFAFFTGAEFERQNRLDMRYVPRRWVSLDGAREPAESQPPVCTRDTVLRVAVAPVISPEKSLQRYRDFVKYLAERMGRSPALLQGDTYAEVNELVRSARCELALVCTYAFVRGEQEFGMEVLAVPQIHGELTYNSLIVVPASSPATSLLDLRGKQFGSADILSTSGWLFPALWLKDRNEDPDSFFSEHVLTGSHDRSLKAVLSGYVNGAAVHSQVYERMAHEDPSVAQRSKVIQTSPSYGLPPLVVRRSLDPSLKNELRTILVNMHTDPEGEETLDTLHIDRFVGGEKSCYDNVREAAQRWESR